MKDWVDIRKDDVHVARERRRARALRESQWWRALVQKGRCHYCGATVAPADLTMDHIVPLARGGTSRRGNIVPCCRACNQTKKHLTPAEQILSRLEGKGQLAE